jgi:predicted alpha/beta-hydrolase family hydrolase
MDTSFMGFIAEGLAAAGNRVVRFEFPDMAGVAKPANSDRRTASRYSGKPGWQ